MKLLIFFLLMTVPSAGLTQTFTDLKRSIDAEFRKVEGVFGLAFFNLRTGEMLLINEREMFHAASTMKTPVMIEIFKWVKEGRLSLGDSIEVKNEFRSIVDGSSYQLDLSDDSDDSMYRRIGGKATIRELMYQMIRQQQPCHEHSHRSCRCEECLCHHALNGRSEHSSSPRC